MTLISKITNIDKGKPVKSSILTTTVTTMERSNRDIQDWLDACDSAIDPLRPDRWDLIEIYKEILTDAHLSALIQTRKLSALGTRIYFIDEAGNVDDEATEKLSKQWMYNFIDLAMDSIFYGYEVIQFGAVKNDDFEYVEKVKEEFVFPQLKQIRRSEVDQPCSNNNIKYLEKPYLDWILEVGNPESLGLLDKACPLVIWKKSSLGSWSEYNEIFGIPTRVGKTDIRDDARRNNMKTMLSNAGSSLYVVMDREDDINFVESGKTGQSEFDPHAERMNTELSKLILGQTMTTDAGSSRSQAVVHEDTQSIITDADLTFLGFLINDKLIPFLLKHGILSKPIRAKFDTDEKLGIQAKATLIQGLSTAFEFDIEKLNEYLPGIPITGTKSFGFGATARVNLAAAFQHNPETALSMFGNILPDIQNPYDSEHSARVVNPDEFEKKSFRRKNIAKGVDVIVGKKTGEETMSVQSYRFDAEIYTVSDAKEWCRDNNVKYISFESAK